MSKIIRKKVTTLAKKNMGYGAGSSTNHNLLIYRRNHRTTGGGESPARHRYHRLKLWVSCRSRMSSHQCMMSCAQGSSVGTTSTSVPECKKGTPDRLAVCTIKRTLTHRLPLTQGGRTTAQQDHNNHSVGGAEPHGQDHQNHRDHRDHREGGGGAENHQHSTRRTASIKGHNSHRVHRKRTIPWAVGGGGGDVETRAPKGNPLSLQQYFYDYVLYLYVVSQVTILFCGH